MIGCNAQVFVVCVNHFLSESSRAGGDALLMHFDLRNRLVLEGRSELSFRTYSPFGDLYQELSLIHLAPVKELLALFKGRKQANTFV